MKKRKKSYEDHLGDFNLRAPGLFKPVRLLVLPGDSGMVALMHEYYADEWCVFSVDARGVPAHSKVYTMKSVSEVMWTELCQVLTEAHKDTLARKIASEKLPPKEHVAAAKELGRLELADDDKYEGIIAKADLFVARHTPEECEAYIARELAAYHERRAAEETDE